MYVAQALRVVANLCRESASPERHGTRHRLLHMRVTGKCGVAFPSRQPIEGIGDVCRPSAKVIDDITEIEPDRGENLIVTRAAQMHPATRGANALRQPPFQR